MAAEGTVQLGALRDPLAFCGHLDVNLSALEQLLPVTVRLDGDRVRVQGNAASVASAQKILDRMLAAARGGTLLTPDDVALAAHDVFAEADSAARVPRPIPKTLLATQRGKEIRPKSDGQRTFVEAIAANTLTFGIGPAGTGKTFLAMVMAVRALRDREVARIILARPAVEAGEKLGFLPGDLKEKVDPYLRPLYDALAELLDDTVVAKYIERGVIEVAPLAYMRGRTLNDAFIILDEAQNATHEQLKMFLTRLGSGSKMIVNGDVTQIDLPRGVQSSLLEVGRLLRGIEGIAIVELSDTDIVRHPLVARIVRAYARER